MTTIYHNPRCSKSRETLAILEQRGITPEIVKYLEAPPSPEALKNILSKLKLKPRDILRSKEPEFKALGLDNTSLSDDELVSIISAHPKLMERPIVVHGKKAALGRPPESVLSIL